MASAGVNTLSGLPLSGARAFARGFNVLLKFARLYGLEHPRTAGQFESAWQDLQGYLHANGESGLLLGTTGSQLLVDGEPIESTAAERSFADLLNAAGIASIGFTPAVKREEFTELVTSFVEAGPRSGSLTESLEKCFGGSNATGIRVNEIRFVAEGAGHSETGLAAEIAVKALGVVREDFQDWFSSPEKIVQLIAAAEGADRGGTSVGTGAGGSGDGPGQGTGGSGGDAGNTGNRTHGTGGSVVGLGTGGGGGAVSGTGPGSGSSSGSARSAKAGMAYLQEADLQSLLRVIAQLGEAAHSGKAQQLDATKWQQKFASLSPPAQFTLRQALAGIAAQAPATKVDQAMWLRLAENLAIRFALERFQRGEVQVSAVQQMLDRLNRELSTLRKLLTAREDKMAAAGLLVESHADVLDRQFWAGVPESGKRTVLTSPEAWCIPPRNVQQYLVELIGRGESDTARNILVNYASCLRNSDAEARKKAATGLSQLAGLLGKAARDRLHEVLSLVGRQMAAEKEAEVQTLLGAAFVRLSQEALAQRNYRAMQQALDSLTDLGETRPSWAEGLRPRIGFESRLPECIEEALAADGAPEGLAGVLVRVPQAAGVHLAGRLARVGRRSERESIVALAKAAGGGCARHLEQVLKSEPPARAASVIGLLSRLNPAAVEELLPLRLRYSARGFHDAAVRQLAIAGAPERGRVLAASLEHFDVYVLPLALDEIGMCEDAGAAAKLLQLAQADILPESSDYVRVKAIEALGRMRAADAVGPLRKFVEGRRALGWMYPEEIRTAAAQALLKLDPEWMHDFLPHSGLHAEALAVAPLDPAPERDVVRYRRYRRVRLPRNVPVVVVSARGKYSSAISVLSLEGGLLTGETHFTAGTEATLKIPAGFRSISVQAVVRSVRAHQASFEAVDMGLEDRARLRRLLASLGRGDASAVGPAELPADN